MAHKEDGIMETQNKDRYSISYEYLDTMGRGPSRGRMHDYPYKVDRGDVISAPFGRAVVKTIRKIS